MNEFIIVALIGALGVLVGSFIALAGTYIAHHLNSKKESKNRTLDRLEYAYIELHKQSKRMITLKAQVINQEGISREAYLERLAEFTTKLSDMNLINVDASNVIELYLPKLKPLLNTYLNKYSTLVISFKSYVHEEVKIDVLNEHFKSYSQAYDELTKQVAIEIREYV